MPTSSRAPASSVSLGASLLVPGEGGHGFPVRGLVDGEEVDLGGLTLRALATPGHTPEHLAYLLLDGGRPTGSVLRWVPAGRLGGPYRPHQPRPHRGAGPLALAVAARAHPGLARRPPRLPDARGRVVLLRPRRRRADDDHRSGEAQPTRCSRPPDEDAFVKLLLGGLGTYPPYFLRLRDVNRTGPQLYGPGEPVLPTLRPDDVWRAAEGRRARSSTPGRSKPTPEGTCPGRCRSPCAPSSRSWLGWVVPDGAPVVFVLEDDQDRADARAPGPQRRLRAAPRRARRRRRRLGGRRPGPRDASRWRPVEQASGNADRRAPAQRVRRRPHPRRRQRRARVHRRAPICPVARSP